MDVRGLVVCGFLAGCASSTRDRAWLADELRERTGAATRPDGGGELPRGVVIEDGLDEDEVVSLALWRNPALRAELTRIDSARATLDEARRPANPQLTVLGPIGPVSAVATLLVPLESLWQMPSRTAAAAREADSTGEAVLMRALDLVRDARLLHIELGLAAERLNVRRQLAGFSKEVARIAAVSASVGDASPMNERVAATDAQINLDASETAELEASTARARLVTQLALGGAATHNVEAAFTTPASDLPAPDELVAIARAARPDVRAAELAVDAAAERAGWERSRRVALGAVVEGNWGQGDGGNMRLGGRAEIPLFGANPGGIGRADAEVLRVAAQHEVVARTALLEVVAARARVIQASRSRERYERDVLPALEEALTIATSIFDSGDESYLVVLDVLRRSGEARLRRAELLAEQRRAACELERALGARLVSANRVAERVRRQGAAP